MIILMVFLYCAVFVFAQTPEAVIREMSGTVEIKKAGSADWQPARLGESIAQSTVISTGFKSTALLAIGNSTLVVRALTRLSLDELLSQNQTETINVALNTGRIRVDVKAPAGSRTNFTVQTPQITASVRGTVFELDPVSIQVYEGTVVFTPAGDGSGYRPVTVSGGEESWVEPDTGQAVNPAAAAEAGRSLPSLPGQASSGDTPDAGGRFEAPNGTLDLTIGVYPNDREG